MPRTTDGVTTIRHGGSVAAVSSTGATLRALVLDGVEVLDGYTGTIAPSGAGQVLAPWPNRLGDGRFTFDGISASVPLNEPARSNAIHGLVRWLEWEVATQETGEVALEVVLPAQPAYPWRLRLTVRYRLDDAGLTVSWHATNEDARRLPFGVGFHPYFRAGPGGADDATLFVPATRHLRTDGRALPVGSESVAEGPFSPIATDGGLPLGGVVLDDCFTGLARDVAGRATVRLRSGAGHDVVIRLDASFTHVMCFTADTLEPDRRRRAVAIEPMTCPPDALRSGDGLVVVEPHSTSAGAFTISLV